MDAIDTRFGMMEQLWATTQQLANLLARKAPTNPTEDGKFAWKLFESF